MAGLAVLLLVLAVGARLMLLTPAGRDAATGMITGVKAGRYGVIAIEGLSGDLMDDFTVRRVTVTDAEGVWLEASDVRIDWTFRRLLARRFHADAIEAQTIRVIRRPIPEDRPEQPPGRAPISISVDRFAAEVALEEGFSREYGRWRISGEADVPRRGDRSAAIDAQSLTRPGDLLHGNVAWGERIDDLRVDLTAHEAEGGPLAGALGYSPDQPFDARAHIDGEVVEAHLRTGDFRPLLVTGRFDGDDGVRLSGFADFAGSDLFEPFARRLGRQVRIGLVALPDPDQPGLQRAGLVLRADNLGVRAHGLVRMADRTAPQGLRLRLNSPSLSQLAGVQLAGETTFDGVVSGTIDALSLRGQASFADLAAGGYRATSLSGPLNLSRRNGVVTISGEAAVEGGSREGITGGLLGPAPRARFEAARLANGALLLRRIDLRGQGLTLEGSGSQALNGALRFSGEARITDAARISPDASGAFGGPVRAERRRPDAPWVLSFDGRGRDLATGLSELDRLLGATPRLRADATLDDGAVEITGAELTGAAGQANASGSIGDGGALRLALGWRAQGPFAVGPLEIDGAATGEGAVTGDLARPVVDLTAAFDQIAAGPLTLTAADLILSFRRGEDQSDGRITLTGASNYGPAAASGDFQLAQGGVRLSGVDVNAGGLVAQGDVTLIDGWPSGADLTFSARPGAFLASGEAEGRIRLREGGGPDSAFVDVTGRNVRLAGSTYLIRRIDLDGRGALRRLPFTLVADVSGDMPVQFNGSGVYALGDYGSHTVSLSGEGQVRDIAFTTRNPIVIAQAAGGQVARVDLGVGGGALIGELRRDDTAILMEANLTSVNLGSLSPDLRGQVTGRISLRGAGDDLSGSANLTMRELRNADSADGLALDGSFNAQLLGDTLNLQFDAVDDGVVDASARLALPVEASAAPLRLAVNRTRPMSGHLSLSGQIQPVWDVFLGGEQHLSGQVNGEAQVGGSINQPRLTGSLEVRDGAFRDTLSGVRLTNLEMDARLDGAAADIARFSAGDGLRGTVTGGGRMNLGQGSASSFTLELNRFRLIQNEIATADATGPITVTRGADGAVQLRGRLNVDEAEIAANPMNGSGIVRMDVIEMNRPGGDPVDTTEASEAERRGPPIGLDITLRSPNGHVWVRGRGLNVEMDVNARVRGTLSSPELTGTASVVRGDYEFAGKRFVFDERGTVRLSTDPSRIRLDLRAVREDPALTAEVRVTGTAASPTIVLGSTPQLPQDEILAQVLFGRSASQLSGFEAAQLAAGVASLTGGGGFDVLGNLRQFAGLDRLSFGGDASALTVAGGRYISDDVYFEIIGGGEGGGAVQVEWQVRRNIAVTSRVESDGDARIAIRWRSQTRQPGTGRGERWRRGGREARPANTDQVTD